MTPESRRPRTTFHISWRSSTSTPAVGSSRNRICGSCASAFAIITRRFMPPESVMIFSVLLVPERQRLEHGLDTRRVARLAEQAAAEGRRVPDRLERVGRELLRHEADQRARGARVLDDVVAVDGHLPRGRVHDAADDVDQRRFARAVRAEHREDLAAADVEARALQRDESVRVGLREVLDRDDGIHESGRCSVEERL